MRQEDREIFFFDFGVFDGPVVKSGKESVIGELEEQLFLLVGLKLLISPLFWSLDEVFVLKFNVDEEEGGEGGVVKIGESLSGKDQK